MRVFSYLSSVTTGESLVAFDSSHRMHLRGVPVERKCRHFPMQARLKRSKHELQLAYVRCVGHWGFVSFPFLKNTSQVTQLFFCL